jgi:hypothetical protein
VVSIVVLAASLILASWNQSQLVADQQAARRPPAAGLAKTDAGCIAEEYWWKDTADNED